MICNKKFKVMKKKKPKVVVFGYIWIKWQKYLLFISKYFIILLLLTFFFIDLSDKRVQYFLHSQVGDVHWPICCMHELHCTSPLMQPTQNWHHINWRHRQKWFTKIKLPTNFCNKIKLTNNLMQSLNYLICNWFSH